jgi:uncharacterized protein (DUF4415 family)
MNKTSKKNAVFAVRRSEGKGDPWISYDFANLPALSASQLADFRQALSSQPEDIEAIRNIEVSESGELLLNRKVGRPRKDPAEKENVVGIRMSKEMIAQLKMLAEKEDQGIGWQTYAKLVLEKHLRRIKP